MQNCTQIYGVVAKEQNNSWYLFMGDWEKVNVFHILRTITQWLVMSKR